MRRNRRHTNEICILIDWRPGPAACLGAQAADMPTLRLELKDGVLNPARIQAPAGVKFRLEIVNTGKRRWSLKAPAAQRKVLAPARNRRW